MFFDKKDQENEKKQIENFSLEEKLKTLNNEELYNLIQNLIKENVEARRLILEWFKEKIETGEECGAKTHVVSFNDELLMEYWWNAEKIISEFNEYGGGSEEDEEVVYDWLGKISELIKDGIISTEAKFDFLDAVFIEYNIDNSGFEDILMDTCFELCQTKEEWEYLVEKLEERPTDWRKKLIMDIQKNCLCNEEAYLKIRMDELHYGMDYWDLVDFYIKKGDSQKSLEIAEQGILKGEGRLTELFHFLFDYFAERKDADNLERIVNEAVKHESDAKELLDKMFEYYRKQNNYEKAKENLLKAYEHTHRNFYSEYKKEKEFLKDSDWEQIEPKIFKDIKEKDIQSYLQICLEKNMKEEVLCVILNPPKNQWRFATDDNFDKFADKLKKDFPDKIIEYCWQKAYNNIKIPGGSRKCYYNAARYLTEAKHIYIKILENEVGWKRRFLDLKTEFKRRPAFLEIVNQL